MVKISREFPLCKIYKACATRHGLHVLKKCAFYSVYTFKTNFAAIPKKKQNSSLKEMGENL
ncbi:MAG: hypothetical protein LLF94_11615 [Chlamydiales bacterium]|nr:hypothetical protein [Chlamydiales bacterium]